jgi:hypothetical protein
LELLRTITILSITNHFFLTILHIPGHLNIAADLLSRNNILKFKQEFPDMEQQATVANMIMPTDCSSRSENI